MAQIGRSKSIVVRRGVFDAVGSGDSVPNEWVEPTTDLNPVECELIAIQLSCRSVHRQRPRPLRQQQRPVNIKKDQHETIITGCYSRVSC